MNESRKLNTEQIISLVNENISVAEMADRLGVEYNILFDYYAECSTKDRRAYPIHLLITKTWLESKIKTATISDICYETKASPKIIHRLADKYGIQTKPMLKDVLTKEVLFALFVEQGIVDKDIAAKYNCSIETIKKLRKKYGITSAARTDVEPKISIEYFHRLYVEYGFTVKQLAKLLGTSVYQVLQLIKEFSSQQTTLGTEIRDRKKGFVYTGIIEELMNELEPILIFEQLKTKALTELAELYDIIPPAEPGVATLSREWLEVVLRKMDIAEIKRKYHLGQYFISTLMEGTDLRPIPPIERLDEKLVRKLYIELHWNDEQIAAITGSVVYTVKMFRKKHNIRSSDRFTLEQRLPIDEFERLYLQEGLTNSQIASLYNVSERRIIDLKVVYSKTVPAISSHKSSGVSEERLQFLKKQLQFKGMMS